jgi:hypothetical protein
MYRCSFELNDQPMSALKLGALSFPAFSGLGSSTNRRAMTCAKSIGPIPPGSYFIVDRPRGDRYKKLVDAVKDLINDTDRARWLALYAADGSVDDETFCNGVVRGNFRLHPRGRSGLSEGCVTLKETQDFSTLTGILRHTPPTPIKNSELRAYGLLVVK